MYYILTPLSKVEKRHTISLKWVVKTTKLEHVAKVDQEHITKLQHITKLEHVTKLEYTSIS